MAPRVPLLALAAFALNRMASMEEGQLQRRAVVAARELAADADREHFERVMRRTAGLATCCHQGRIKGNVVNQNQSRTRAASRTSSPGQQNNLGEEAGL
jgi:hypothetical protein